MSTAPNFSTTCLTPSSHAAGSATFHLKTSTPFSDENLSAASEFDPYVAATLHPLFFSAMDIAAPIPLVPSY